MARTFRYRLGVFAGALAVAVAASSVAAKADLFVVIGARHTVENQPIGDCSARAKSALTSVLASAFEAGDGTGEWLGYGPQDSSGHSSEAAAIHCFPLDTGYTVTITCSTEVPPNPMMAKDLCAKLDAAFGASQTAATPPAR